MPEDEPTEEPTPENQNTMVIKMTATGQVGQGTAEYPPGQEPTSDDTEDES